MACLSGIPGDSAHVPVLDLVRWQDSEPWLARRADSRTTPRPFFLFLRRSTTGDRVTGDTAVALRVGGGHAAPGQPLLGSGFPSTHDASRRRPWCRTWSRAQKGSFPQNFVDADGTLFFLAFDRGNFFDKLWASDGTGPGTHEVAANLEATAPAALGASGSVAFTAFDLNCQSFGIWVSDGTTAGTHQIAALPPSGTDAVGVVGATAFFEIFDFQDHQEELWKSDGTASGTGFVATIPFTTGFTASGGKLFFAASDATHGYELWTSDGTAAGTGLVADINPGPGNSYPSQLTDAGGTLYFLAQVGSGMANELWTSDGTAARTRAVVPGLVPDQLAAFQGGVVFTGVDATGNPGLWSSDGTSAGTHEIALACPDGSASRPGRRGWDGFFGFYPDSSDSATSSSGRVTGPRRGRPRSPP